MSNTPYPNPTSALEERPFYGLNSAEFKSMIAELFKELSIDTKQKQYCLDCHWIYARAGHKMHRGHSTINGTEILSNRGFT